MNLIAKNHFGSCFDASCAMQRFCATALLVSVTMLVAIDADAQTIKKWVDEEGVTHYSDQLPVGEEAEVREVDIPEAPVSGYDSREVNERLKKQLQELEEAREAREREAEAVDRARELDEALEREPVVEQEKKKKKDRDRPYSGPYPKPPPGPFPKPLPGPFPEQYPRQRSPATPENPIERDN